MKPGYERWATNAQYSGAPLQDTKKEPSPGKRDDGYEENIAPAPIVWNYLVYALTSLVTACSSVRTFNLLETDDLSVGNEEDFSGFYSPTDGTHILVGNANGTLVVATNSLDGSLAWHAGGYSAQITAALDARVDDSGVQAIIGTQSAAPHPVNSRANSTSNWVDWATGTIAINGLSIEHDWIGRWVIVLSTGVVYTSTGTGVAFAAASTPPGFAASTWSRVRHSHHPVNHLFDGDPGNSHWIALTNTEISDSADGLVWTAAAAHGFGGTPDDLAYSADGTKWIATMLGGGLNYQESTDNGSTWTSKTNVNSKLSSWDSAVIASDGSGHWLLLVAEDGVGVEIHGSVDNGDSWSRLEFPTDPPSGGTATYKLDVWYGGGRFGIAVGDDFGNTNSVYVTLRGEE